MVERVDLCFSLALLLGEDVAEYLTTLLTFFFDLDKSDNQWPEATYDRQRVKRLETDVRIDGPQNDKTFGFFLAM
jgi:hypothetical protein